MRKHRTFLFVVCCLALTTLAFGKTHNNKTIVTYPSAFAVSQPLSELPINNEVIAGREMPEPRPSPLRSRAVSGPWQEDPVLQTETGPMVSATPGVDFDGIPANGLAPSDSNIAVGPNHIVETVNVRLAVYDKSGSGTPLAGPTDLITFFAPLGGDCAAGASDPIVNYDRLADRWVISDVGIGNAFSECIGVSKTNDPAGAYSLYAFSFGTTLNDYPKVGVWPTASNSAYLATYNLFVGRTFKGAKICGFDRTKMLAGTANPAQLCGTTPNTEGGYLPSDLDGPTPPTDGTPGLFLTWQNNNPGQLFLRKLSLNFALGAVTLSFPTTISVANTSIACVGTAGACVPQSGTTQLLDTLGDRLMYRFPVRHFADHDRAVVNHAVANGSQVAIRWYELFDPAATVTLHQQGTFAPDTTYRWMGSIAEDRKMDIGLGYSASSASINPAIRFTGRVPSDPLGTMETEASILVGTGSQTNVPNPLSRWGDYTAMQVDPSDDCTFWYVNQYEKVDGTFNWSTNIGSFAFTGCGPDFTVGASPSSLTIPQGGNGTSTITVTSLSGFNSATTLSASGLPSGVTEAFAPNPVTPPANGNVTSSLTLTASDTATTGTATVTITGTSGSLVRTTTITLTVHQGFTVTLTDPPAANPGQSTTTNMQIATSDGSPFASNVTFTLPCSGLPAGATCSFSPTQISSTATSPQTVQITVQTTGPFTGLAGPTHSGPQHKLRSQNQRLWLPLSLPLASMVLVGLAGRSLPRRYKIVGLCLILTLTGFLVACGGGSSSPPPPPPPISVSVSPNTPVNTLYPNSILPGEPAQTQQFSAVVHNSSNQAVTWAITTNKTDDSIDQAGLYTAPSAVPSGPVTITATSMADTSKSGPATVTIHTPTPPGTFQITVTVTEGTTVKTTTFNLTVN